MSCNEEVMNPKTEETNNTNTNATTDTNNNTNSFLKEHSNANLLKINTWDKYSTVSHIKRFIIENVPSVKARMEAGNNTTSVGEGASNNNNNQSSSNNHNNVNSSGHKTLFEGQLRMNKNPKTPYLFLAFDTPEHRAAALEVLQTLSYRRSQWKEEPVTAWDLKLTHKGGTNTQNNNNSNNKRPRDGEEDGEGASKLTQYEQYSLEKQLELKEQHCMTIMKSILPWSKDRYNECKARFKGVLPSPVTTGYRNHVNLSFGRDKEGQPTLGFQTGAMVDGNATIQSAVEEEKDIVTMHPLAKVIAQEVMRVAGETLSELPVFDKVQGKGFWRKLQVRHNTLGEILMDLELDGDSVSPERFTEIKNKLKEAFSSPALEAKLQAAADHKPGERNTTAKVVSLQCHCHTGTGSLPPTVTREVLLGSSVLVEHLCGLQFELSPTAFFQVNTPGMEQMLAKVQEVADLSPSTTLLDLCSGTGTIGLTLARHVKKVIGIELVEEAVENAKRNAVMNEVHNATFIAGRVENVLPDVIHRLSEEDKKDIVAILDPPRAGVNGTVLKWMRRTPTIRKVVYISCEQKALQRDCPAFTKEPTKAYTGMPFEVTSAFGVDLFPHTHHVEMVAVLTRKPDEEEKEHEEKKEEVEVEVATGTNVEEGKEAS